MAKRTMRPYQDERARAAIQTTQILKRLAAHLLGTLELSTTQVKAAEILLRKTLPDLSSVEHLGSVEHYVVHAPPVEASPDAWQQQHLPKPH